MPQPKPKAGIRYIPFILSLASAFLIGMALGVFVTCTTLVLGECR